MKFLDEVSAHASKIMSRISEVRNDIETLEQEKQVMMSKEEHA
jgi:hypothetical protein